MACIITYENKQYTQKEFEQYFKEHFTEFVDNFLGSKQDIEGFKNFITDKSLSLQPKLQLNETDIRENSKQTVKQSITKIQDSKSKLWSLTREQSIDKLLEDLSDYIQRTISREGNERSVSWTMETGQDNTNINRISDRTLRELWNDRQRNFGDFSIGLGLYVIQKLTDANSEFTGLRKAIEQQLRNGSNITVNIVNSDKKDRWEYIAAFKNRLEINPYKFGQHFINAPSLENILNDTESILLEEHIHLVTLNMLTAKDEQNILNEMPEKLKDNIRSYYSPNISNTEMVHEYLRIIVQDMLSGRTSELVQNYDNIALSILRRVFEFIKKAFEKLSDNSVTKQKVNEIYNFIKQNTSSIQNNMLSVEEANYKALVLTDDVMKRLYNDSSKLMPYNQFQNYVKKYVYQQKALGVDNETIIDQLKCI